VAPSLLLFLTNSSHNRPRNYNSRAVAATATMDTLAANVTSGAITEVVAAVTPGVAPASGACLATPGLPLRLLRPTTTIRGLGPSICGLIPGLLLLLMHRRHLRIRPMLLVHQPMGWPLGRPSSRPCPSSTISSTSWLGSAGPCSKL